MCSEWQPIETAPRDGTWLWLFFPDRVEEDRQCVGWWESDYQLVGYWVDHADSNITDPTHWMPLPEPPLVDHPRPTTPVVDHEGGESDPQATRISELEAEVERLKRDAYKLEREIWEELEACVKIAESQITEPGLSENPAYVRFEPSHMMARNIATLIRCHMWRKERKGPRSTAMNKGGGNGA